MKNFAFALGLPLVTTLAACDSTPPASHADVAPDAMTSGDVAPAPAESASNDQAATQSPPINETSPPPADAAHRYASWAGKWTGVEGMYLVIKPTAEERYSLVMQYDLDNKATVEGRDSEHGIQFTRNGEKLSLTRAAGKEIGLKYLDGKSQCLMVKPGEGYCRD